MKLRMAAPPWIIIGKGRANYLYQWIMDQDLNFCNILAE